MSWVELVAWCGYATTVTLLWLAVGARPRDQLDQHQQRGDSGNDGVSRHDADTHTNSTP